MTITICRACNKCDNTCDMTITICTWSLSWWQTTVSLTYLRRSSAMIQVTLVGTEPTVGSKTIRSRSFAPTNKHFWVFTPNGLYR